MFSKVTTIAAVLLCMKWSSCLCQQEADNYIFSIRVTSEDNRQFVQTGFRLRTMRGILTALHGVASAKSITALNKKGVVYSPLRIVAADITRDAALLYTENMGTASTVGFFARTPEAIAAQENLMVTGHPQGIGLTIKSVHAGSPVRRPLESMIPPRYAAAFSKRNSPGPHIDVLYIDGSLVPGHSGAPILDQNNRVVGIANGGILGGAAGISWAIPIADIQLKELSRVQHELAVLKNSASDQLFDYELLDDTVSVTGKQFDTEFFEIKSLKTIVKTISLRDITHNFNFEQPIDAESKPQFLQLARKRILAYLKSDSGTAMIRDWMSDFRNQNTHGQALTFPTSVTLDSLGGFSEQEALQHLSIGDRFDERWVTVDDIDITFRYSDLRGSYHGTINNATIGMTFNAAVCSDIMHLAMSQHDLEFQKYGWPKFLVINVVQRSGSR